MPPYIVAAPCEKQAKRIQYLTYLRLGLPFPEGARSGAVVGACKHLVADRFRGTGLRWKLETAAPLLQIRAALLDLRLFTLAAT